MLTPCNKYLLTVMCITESRAVARNPRDAAGVLFGLKFADNIQCKFKSSQALKDRLQSSKHTVAKQNLTQNGTANFKPTRTAAASHGFIAAPPVSCFVCSRAITALSDHFPACAFYLSSVIEAGFSTLSGFRFVSVSFSF